MTTTSTTRPQGMRLVDYVRELTEPHTHSEHYTIRTKGAWVGHDHRTRVPSLLAQLWENDTPSQGVNEGPRPGFASRPAARIEALDTAARIDLEANRWITDLGEQTRHLETYLAIRQLHGLSAGADMVTQKAIEKDARRWWTQARIVTGWDSPAWTPDNTCPACGERGTLRVRLAERIGMCTYAGDMSKGREACRVTWDEASIGVLADHIRLESAERRRHEPPGACWCPVPAPSIPDLSRLCPACGSARCHRALGARLVDTLRARRGA